MGNGDGWCVQSIGEGESVWVGGVLRQGEGRTFGEDERAVTRLGRACKPIFTAICQSTRHKRGTFSHYSSSRGRREKRPGARACVVGVVELGDAEDLGALRPALALQLLVLLELGPVHHRVHNLRGA